MYRGKHCMKSNRRTGKLAALLVSVMLLLCISVGGVVAFLLDATDPVTNIFDPSRVTTAVVETIDGAVKRNVSIKNTGDIPAWIRAYVVVNWKNADGNVYGTPPVSGTDYTIDWNLTDWAKGSDGFYYYTLPVDPDKTTGNLIDSVEALTEGPSGYTLAVEIIGSGLQSEPASVFAQAWSGSGLSVANGKIGGGT